MGWNIIFIALSTVTALTSFPIKLDLKQAHLKKKTAIKSINSHQKLWWGHQHKLIKVMEIWKDDVLMAKVWNKESDNTNDYFLALISVLFSYMCWPFTIQYTCTRHKYMFKRDTERQIYNSYIRILSNHEIMIILCGIITSVFTLYENPSSYDFYLAFLVRAFMQFYPCIWIKL